MHEHENTKLRMTINNQFTDSKNFDWLILNTKKNKKTEDREQVTLYCYVQK